MSDRRAFISGVAASIFASPVVILAQHRSKVSRIGTLASNDGLAWDGFRRQLLELGYVEGGNLTLESRWAQGRPDRFPALAAELVDLKVDVIVTSSMEASFAAQRATRSIPIVMALSAYPDRMGLVDSLAHPGGNITGFNILAPELAGKRFELLKMMAPKVSRMALLGNPASRIEVFAFQDTKAAALANGIELLSIDVRGPDDYPTAFAAVIAGRADAIHAVGNPVNFAYTQLIADFAFKAQLPSSFEQRLFVDAGGLISYGPNFIDLFRRAAQYVDKILKGSKPDELPIQQPTKFELVINARTAKALNLAVPGSLLMRADEVLQ